MLCDVTGNRFRVLFLSTGELSLADKIAEGGLGRRVKAGQEVRLVDIPADAGKGLGLFEQLHGSADAETFIQALRAGTTRAYGSAAVAFLEYLVTTAAADLGFADENRDWMQKLVARWVLSHPDAGGQVRSVARRFAPDCRGRRKGNASQNYGLGS
jgi:putative DNA primase/helicase